ncbi:MAG: endonuclease/exonuclease/phosphatase family protein [Acidimicrobiales bacterium]
MKKLWIVGLLVAALTAVMVTPSEAWYSSRPRQLEVMSQNLYIGADLGRLLQGASPAELLATVQQTNYPDRAVEIAQGIDDFNPDLIGLQEVTQITILDGQLRPVAPPVDYLTILLDALAAEGEHYAVAATVTNADATLPVGDGTYANVVDRDVILYRTSTTRVSNPASGNYTTNFVATVFGTEIPFTRGWVAVDAHVAGRHIRFVNTHLEVEDAPCLVDGSLVECQDVQATELVGIVGAETDPVVLVGDFNAQPGETAYRTIDDAGFVDTWTIRYPLPREAGYTCCQSETLDNVESQLDKRIDHIWLSDGDFGRFVAQTTVVGDWAERKTPGGLWYSDHGGPFARLHLFGD